MKMLVLCHGNINRSPSCEAVLKDEGLDVVSAGFKMSQKCASKKMRDTMAVYGYDLLEHKPQLVTQELVDWADQVVIMDGGNRKRFYALFPHDTDKLYCLADVVAKTRIPDPAFMRKDSKEFHDVVGLIVGASLVLANRTKEITIFPSKGIV